MSQYVHGVKETCPQFDWVSMFLDQPHDFCSMDNSRNNLRDTSEFHGAHHPYPIAHLNYPFITTAISIDYPKSPIPLIFHWYPNLIYPYIYIYITALNQIIYCQFVIIAHLRNYPWIAREISTDPPSYQTTCRASSISMTLSRLWNSVSVRAPLVKWRRWGKIGMCHQQTMWVWEYAKGFCLSVYLSNFVCDMYCISRG